jgi:hypothetical protein
MNNDAKKSSIDTKVKSRLSRKSTDGRAVELLLRVVLWIVFSVIIGLLPFLAKLLILYMKNEVAGLQSIFSDGYLFITSSIIAASAIGELVANLSGKSILTRGISIGALLAVGATLCIIILGSFSSAELIMGGGSNFSKERITSLSIWIFFWAVVSGLGCLFFAEVCKWNRK